MAGGAAGVHTAMRMDLVTHAELWKAWVRGFKGLCGSRRGQALLTAVHWSSAYLSGVLKPQVTELSKLLLRACGCCSVAQHLGQEWHAGCKMYVPLRHAGEYSFCRLSSGQY